MMLEKLREKTQTNIAKFIMAAITLAFVVTGANMYRNSNPGADTIATVAGQDISYGEFSNAMRAQQQQMQSMLGPQYDAAMMDNPESRKAVLDSLINPRLLVIAAADAGMVVSDKQVDKFITEVPLFQEDGKFSQSRYEAFLKTNQITDKRFKARRREDLQIQHLREAVTDTPIISQTVVDNFIRASEQTREVSVANFPFEQYMAQVKLPDGAGKTYFDTHQPEFEIPAQVKLEYLVLSVDLLAEKMEVTDDEVKKIYGLEENKPRFVQKEERKASHILINSKADDSDADKKIAREKAEELLKQAKQKGTDFADLAKKNSQDTGSAVQGGDLGFFGKGSMVKPFEEAAFSMAKGEIRGPIQSDYGFHIIKLVDTKPEKVRSLAEASGEIRLELKKQKAQKAFNDTATDFGAMVFDQSGSLKPTTEKFKLVTQTSDWISRKGIAPPPLNNEKLLKAVFADEVLKEKRNTEAVETAPNTLVSARVLEAKPATIRPFDEVKLQIQQKLLHDEAAKIAIKEGQAQLAQVKAGKEIAGAKWPALTKISRDKPAANLPPQATEAAFKLPSDKLPAYTGIETPGGYFLVKLTQVQDGGTVDEAKRKNYSERIKSALTQQDFTGFLAALRANAKVTVNQALLEKKESRE